MARVKRNVTVVGDDAQAIYSFRGASFENILGFPRALSGREDLPPDAQLPLDAARSSRSPTRRSPTTSASSPRSSRRAARPGRCRPSCALPDIPDQARFVAQRLLEWHDEGDKLQDLAVLYRAHYQALELQIELTRRGIPYEIRSGDALLRAAPRQGRARVPAHRRESEGRALVEAGPEDLPARRASARPRRSGRRSAAARSARGVPRARRKGRRVRARRRGGVEAVSRAAAASGCAVARVVAVRGHPLGRRGRLPRLRARQVPQRRLAARRPRAVRPVRPDLRLAADLPRGGHALQRALGRGRGARGSRTTTASCSPRSTRPRGSSGAA